MLKDTESGPDLRRDIDFQGKASKDPMMSGICSLIFVKGIYPRHLNTPLKDPFIKLDISIDGFFHICFSN